MTTKRKITLLWLALVVFWLVEAWALGQVRIFGTLTLIAIGVGLTFLIRGAAKGRGEG